MANEGRRALYDLAVDMLETHVKPGSELEINIQHKDTQVIIKKMKDKV